MQSITTKYYGPTNNRGSRIRAAASGGRAVTVSYDHALNNAANHDEAARALAAKLNWTGALVRGELAYGYVYVWANDDRLELK